MLLTILTLFYSYFTDSILWLVGGAFFGAVIERMIKPEWVEPWLQSKTRSVYAAIVAGAALPGCAMSTMPLAASLRKRGASLGTLTAFIMIAPILSPHTIVLNAVMLGIPMTVGRILLPVIMTLFVGILINHFQEIGVRCFTLPASSVPQDTCHAGCCEQETSSKKGLWKSFLSTLATLLPFLLIGLLVVAVIQALVPEDFISHYLSSGWQAYLAAAVSGIPLYVCEGAEVPLTASLLKLGVGQGPAFTFLLSSVGTCLPTIIMAPRIIGVASTFIYVISWLILSVGGGYLFGQLASHF